MKTLNNKAFAIAFKVTIVGITMQTPVYIRPRRLSSLIEARVGIAIHGEWRDQGTHTPFDAEFDEQWQFGIGRTEEEALEKLKDSLVRYSACV